MEQPKELIRLEELNEQIETWPALKQVDVIRSLIERCKCSHDITDDELIMLEVLELGFGLSLEEADKVGHG